MFIEAVLKGRGFRAAQVPTRSVRDSALGILAKGKSCFLAACYFVNEPQKRRFNMEESPGVGGRNTQASKTTKPGAADSVVIACGKQTSDVRCANSFAFV